jgi:hypothetical protein
MSPPTTTPSPFPDRFLCIFNYISLRRRKINKMLPRKCNVLFMFHRFPCLRTFQFIQNCQAMPKMYVWGMEENEFFFGETCREEVWFLLVIDSKPQRSLFFNLFLKLPTTENPKNAENLSKHPGNSIAQLRLFPQQLFFQDFIGLHYDLISRFEARRFCYCTFFRRFMESSLRFFPSKAYRAYDN